MATSSTCQADPSPLLLTNYQRCLVWRCQLWFGNEVKVSRVEATSTLLLTRAGHPEARLSFSPQRCRWLLDCAEWQFEGSFDRMSKRVRQIFSGITAAPKASRCALNEEEAEALTRTAKVE